ncbi:MAG: glutamate racemase [Ethanoligenens sp.]|uniref:glutamate racemase n=1 Tax=Ethanoligenens sp. TaxID=2099655 RepID=UPI0039E72CC5
MDNRPIGVFDSGLGGLTVIRELEHVLPHENLIYFGDTGRVPYGTKGNDTIMKYAEQIVRFLRGFDVKAILIACGTVSSVAFDVVSALAEVPVYGVVEPAARSAVEKSSQGDILILGTSATVRSGSYEKAIKRLNPDAVVRSGACPLFVPLVENDHFSKDDVLADMVAHEYLDTFLNRGVDTVILGCTHYPILRPLIAGIMGESVALVDAGSEMADTAAVSLEVRGLLSDRKDIGKQNFYVSDYSEDFTRLAGVLLEHSLAGYVEKTDIEKY